MTHPYGFVDGMPYTVAPERVPLSVKAQTPVVSYRETQIDPRMLEVESQIKADFPRMASGIRNRPLVLHQYNDHVVLSYGIDCRVDILAKRCLNAKFKQGVCIIEQAQLPQFLASLFRVEELRTRYWPPQGMDENLARFVDELTQVDAIHKASWESFPTTVIDGNTGELRRYQTQGVEWGVRIRYFLLAFDVGLGKAQPLDAKILTPTGWTTMGELQVGSVVANPDGGETTVTHVFPQGMKHIYRVTFSDGSSTECCDDHLWSVQSPNHRVRKSGFEVKPLSVIRQDLTWANGHSKNFIPMTAPQEFSPLFNLPLNPYVLGVLLGDGGLAHAVVNLNTNDQEIADTVGALLAVDFPEISVKGTPCKYALVSPPGKPNRIRRILDKNGLRCKSIHKHIPQEYLWASIEDRTSLLQGLLDTDGHIREDGNIEFSSSSRKLIHDVQFLVQSLGGCARIRSKETHYTKKGSDKKFPGQTSYRISVQLPEGIMPFRFSGKALKYRGRSKYPPSRAIVRVDYVGKKYAQCIRVANPNHLYVTDDFIVTHNSITLLVMILRIRRNTPGAKAIVWCSRTNRRHPWVEETEKFTALSWTIVEGTPAERRQLYQSTADVLIVTYDQLINDNAQMTLAIVHHQRVIGICDESSNLKNDRTKRYEEFWKMRQHLRWLGLLNGTPMENSIDELYSQLKLLQPGTMGKKKDFLKKFAVFLPDGTINKKQIKNGQELRELIAPMILRRTKDEVASELPTLVQKRIYLEPNLYQQALLTHLDKACENPLEAFIRQQQVTDSPALIPLEIYQEYGIPNFQWDEAYNPKLIRLKSLLAEELHDQKVILFTRFAAMDRVLAHELREYNPLVLDGAKNDNERDFAVREFQTNPARRLIILTTAGSKGLTLTAASTVIFYDLLWNPKIMEQIWGRAHRIGADHVQILVLFLLLEGGVEDRMWRILGAKTRLSDALVDGRIDLLDDFAQSAEEDVREVLGWSQERYQAAKASAAAQRAANRALAEARD